MIRRGDRISDVLKRDEALVDVLVAVSPAFERLRSSAMRKVMSRLVTVEQAAAIGGVDPDALVHRLNAALERRGYDGMTSDRQETGTAAMTARRPAELAGIAADRIVEADVRDDLRSGREPFSRIMAALQSVPEGGALMVRAIFEPVPLYAVMAKQKLARFTEQLADDDWCVWFYRESGSAASLGAATSADHRDAEAAAVPAGPASPAAERDMVVLDVRDLEPPEPMMRTLAALESLAPGATLLQINVRVPQFLLPLLDERGYVYEIREQDPGLVRVFIRRAAADDAASHPTEQIR